MNRTHARLKFFRPVLPGIKQREGLPIHRCSTGEAYDTLLIGGVKPQGNEVERWYKMSEAFDSYLVALRTYLLERDATAIEWRAHPELIHMFMHNDRTEEYRPRPNQQAWQVWSRLAVTQTTPELRELAEAS